MASVNRFRVPEVTTSEALDCSCHTEAITSHSDFSSDSDSGKFSMGTRTLIRFCSCTIESILGIETPWPCAEAAPPWNAKCSRRWRDHHSPFTLSQALSLHLNFYCALMHSCKFYMAPVLFCFFKTFKIYFSFPSSLS